MKLDSKSMKLSGLLFIILSFIFGIISDLITNNPTKQTLVLLAFIYFLLGIFILILCKRSN